jgi:hypothetical protein
VCVGIWQGRKRKTKEIFLYYDWVYRGKDIDEDNDDDDNDDGDNTDLEICFCTASRYTLSEFTKKKHTHTISKESF